MDATTEAGPPPRRCSLHSDSDAVEVCDRCGAFLCQRCRREVGGSTLCAACDDRGRNRPPSRTAVLALILAALGPIGLLPGIAGWALGARELRRIRSGQSPATGEGYARIARALGALSAVALVAAALWALARVVG